MPTPRRPFRLPLGTAWKEDRTSASPNSPSALAFAASTRRTSAAIILKPGLAQGLASAIAPDWSPRRSFPTDEIHLSGGQDHRLPYESCRHACRPGAQSMAVRLSISAPITWTALSWHGPSSRSHWTTDDFEIWQAMMEERDAGTRASRRQQHFIEPTAADARAHAEPPAFAQNRMHARLGWDAKFGTSAANTTSSTRDSRGAHGHVEVLRHPAIGALATKSKRHAAQKFLPSPCRSACCHLPALQRRPLKQEPGQRSLELPMEAGECDRGNR